MSAPPVFAVVGHPNKGKSSIVATLAEDDSVRISPVPGTTTKSRHFPMRVDGEVLYELVDTPGFQRARAALAWMEAHSETAADRRDTVRQFVEEHQHEERFHDERELLAPIVDGAGILYVVDGSRPYGEEYEAEMEIMRWTGRPSMALINLIGEGDYAEQWKAALGQYFRIVRVFDAQTAEFTKRLELLRAFGELEESWRTPMSRAVQFLQDEWQHRWQQSANAIAAMLADMLTMRTTQRVHDDEDVKKIEQKLGAKHQQKIANLEAKCRREVESMYQFHDLQREESDFSLLELDLFAEDTWKLFGLSRSQLITTGAIGGAVAGSGIDIATGGSSLLLGAGIGAVVGGATMLFSGEQLAQIKILGLPLGGKEMSIGPIKSTNFPYVVLARALLHHDLVAQRTHAQQGKLKLNNDNDIVGAQRIPDSRRRKLERLFAKLRKAEPDESYSLVRPLAKEIESLFQS